MRTRHLHPAVFLVIIPLSLAAVVWAFGTVSRLLFPLVTNVVRNGLGSWVFPATDEHCFGKTYMTQQSSENRITPTHMTAATTTTAATGAGTNTPFLLDYYYRHTTCAIVGMVLVLPLAVCISILVSRSYVKIPIDLTDIYTSWNRHHDDNDSFLVVPSTPIPPASGDAVIVSSLSSPTPSPTPSPPSATIDSQEEHFSVHTPAAIKIATETTPDPHTLPTKLCNTEAHLTSQSSKPNKEEQLHHHLSTATLIDKRKKKRPKQTKKKERGKRDASLEEMEKEMASSVKQQKQQQQHQKSYKGSTHSQSPLSPHPSQKMPTKEASSIFDRALANHQQSTIIVPPPPPPPPPHSPRSVNLTGTAPPRTPIVTQKIPNKLAAQMSTNDNRAPPSPAVSPKDAPSTSLAKHGTKTISTTTTSPALVQQPQQPMVTKLIANKKDPLPAPTAPLAPFPSKPKSAPLTSPPSIISTGNAAVDSTSRQSWYSPFNTGLSFDLLSRSPPSPATSCLPPSSTSSLNRTDYRLLPDSSYHRIPSANSSHTGVYPYLQQQQQQSNQQTHHHHQHQHHLHQQPHSLQYRHNNEPHSQYQLSHVGQHSNSYDYLLYGTLPKAPPMRVSPPPPCIESSSSIADLPPPTPPPAELVATRLPTPPVSLSPVIAPPTLPSTREKSAETTTFPFSMWYPWKPRPLSAADSDEEASPSFSLFDRKLSFHSSGA